MLKINIEFIYICFKYRATKPQRYSLSSIVTAKLFFPASCHTKNQCFTYKIQKKKRK